MIVFCARLEQRPAHRATSSTSGSSALLAGRSCHAAGARRARRAGGRGVAVAAVVRRADPGLCACADGSGTGGGASLGRARDSPRRRSPTRPSTPATLADLRARSRRRRRRWMRWRELLAGPPTEAALSGVPPLPRRSSPGRQARLGPDDGEGDPADAALAAGEPRMLLDDPDRRCSTGTATRCGPSGVDARPRRGRGRPGSATRCGGLLHGAKEALRQATYWQMKNRAGTVGRAGLGPLLGQLRAGRRSCGRTSSATASARDSSPSRWPGLPDGPSPVRR